MTEDTFLSDFMDNEIEPDLRFTSDKEIIKGLDKPDNAVVYYIGNYPPDDIYSKIDRYVKELRPPNKLWDDVLNTGSSKEPGSGWASTGFQSKYMEYLNNNNEAYRKAQEVRARATVRPVYIGHHPSKEMYSPARICIWFIEDGVELPVER